MGEFAELSRRWPLLIQQAVERGDLYEAMNLSTYILALVRLAADDPSVAREELTRNMASLSKEGYHVQHNDALWAMTQVELYMGEGRAAWDLLAGSWPALSRSMLLRVQFIRVSMRHLRARCALAAASGNSSPATLLRVAERDARSLEREGMPWASALAKLIRAGLSASAGDRDGALSRLAGAETALEAVDMRLYSAVARRRRGALLGGSEGAALIASADAWMSAQDIRNPARMAEMYAPGFGSK
jgi:hypothetical protein